MALEILVFWEELLVSFLERERSIILLMDFFFLSFSPMLFSIYQDTIINKWSGEIKVFLEQSHLMAAYTYKTMRRKNAMSLNSVIRIVKYNKNSGWAGGILVDRAEAINQSWQLWIKNIERKINLAPTFNKF